MESACGVDETISWVTTGVSGCCVR